LKVLLARLRDAFGLELIEHLHAGTLCIHKSDGLLFKVTVPNEVLEWFVEAYDDSGAMWSEWADYYPINGETREQLVTEMACEIERVVTHLVNSEIRASHDQVESQRYIELKVGGSWQSASLIWLTAAPKWADAP
jgi:hypothetical protein